MYRQYQETTDKLGGNCSWQIKLDTFQGGLCPEDNLWQIGNDDRLQLCNVCSFLNIFFSVQRWNPQCQLYFLLLLIFALLCHFFYEMFNIAETGNLSSQVWSTKSPQYSAQTKFNNMFYLKKKLTSTSNITRSFAKFAYFLLGSAWSKTYMFSGILL